MKTSKTLFAAAALALAAAAPSLAQAAGVVVLYEPFNNINNLPGWAQVNNSQPVGQAWFQGNPGVFEAQSGAADSYIAASYLSARNGIGLIDNWLITPELTLSATTLLSFYTRTQSTPGLNDVLEVRFSADGSAPGDFSTLLTTVGGSTDYPGNWQQFSLSLDGDYSGHFAFRYLGDAGAANYIGIDNLSITTAVPEPSAYLMLGIGLAALSLVRRTRS